MSRVLSLSAVLVLPACNEVNPLYTTTELYSATVASTSTSDASSTGGSTETTSAGSSSTGVPVNCGDGEPDPGEQCDDGAQNGDHSACKSDCTVQVCGDGSVGPGEDCDDAASNADDAACKSDCTVQTCGDGALGAGEACDDGPNNADDAACKADCTVQVCGDGFVGPGEGCDAGPNNADDALCKANCVAQACGDGDVGPGEGCDDGNPVDGDGCSACVLDSCGDGVFQMGEACDDGDADPDDGCTPMCTLPTCGDEFVQPSLGEACDDGIANSDGGACTQACQVAVCGDGLVRVGVETCDDAAFNGLLGACSATCVAAACGDGVLQMHEGCDDGNTVSGDGCRSDCALEVALTQGFYHTCALVDGDELRCWGRGTYGQLGYGSTMHLGDQPGELPTPVVDLGQHAVLSLASSQNSNCAVLDDATLRCWGGNDSGQLGINNTAKIGDQPGEMPPDATPLGEPAAAVVSNNLSFCTRTVSDSVRCMGLNQYGNLGLGVTSSLGDNPGEMPAGATPVGLIPQLLAGGGNHFCAGEAAGEVRCWGRNHAGQLGYGDTEDRGDQPGELPTPAVDVGGEVVVQLAVGSTSTCALLVSGAVRCWGGNDLGQLGYGDTTDRGDGPGELPTPDLDLGGPAVRLGLGLTTSCALMADRQVRCWGRNVYGQLGVGSTEPIGDQAGEMPPAVTPLGGDVLALFVGPAHNCALLVGGDVRCWGLNNYGQLGIGSLANLGDDEAVLSVPPVLFE